MTLDFEDPSKELEPKIGKRAKPRSKRIDATLAILIILSILTIAGQFIWKRLRQSPTGSGSESAAAAPHIAYPISAPDKRKKGAIETSLPIDDAHWQLLLPELKKQRVTESLGCFRKAPRASALFFFDFNPRSRMIADQFRNSWIFTANDCYKVGDRILIFAGGQAPNEPYISVVGEVEIKDIVRGPVADFPEKLFSLLGISKGRLQPFDFQHPTDGSVFAIFRFAPANFNIEPPKFPPLQFPLTKVITGEKAPNIYGDPNLTIIDVRSESEYRARSVPGAINIPFKIKSNKFSWNVNLAEVQNSNFEIASLMDRRNQPVAVVGADRTDGRSFWAISEMYRAGFRRLIWLPEGVPSD